MTTLYALTSNYLQIQQLIDDGADANVFTDTLSAIEDSVEAKAEGYFYVIKNTQADIDAIKAEETRLADRRRAMENKVTNMKKNLEESMIAVDTKKIKTAIYTANIQRNAPSLRVIDEKKIPLDYFVDQAPKLDKKTLLADAKERDINGVEVVQTESLRLR